MRFSNALTEKYKWSKCSDGQSAKEGKKHITKKEGKDFYSYSYMMVKRRVWICGASFKTVFYYRYRKRVPNLKTTS